jgi:hypothetical protein
MRQKWAFFIDGAYGNGDGDGDGQDRGYGGGQGNGDGNGRGNGDSFDDDARRVPPVRPR